MPGSHAGLARELSIIRASFRQLASAFGRIAPALMAIPDKAEKTATRGAAKPPRRKPRLSRERHAALKLQGRYIGTIRVLPAAKRAKVKRVRVEKGVRAAIAYARRIAS